jgi:glycosyltransferase involved in cell wall biosynthesis
MDKCKIAIIIPALNEEATIANVVQSVKKHGTVIVINDASNDNTEQEAISAGAVLVSHEKNKGYDSALNSGFIKAKELDCKFVITYDADGQHTLESVEQYIRLLKQGFLIVIGIRNKLQRVSEYIFSWVAVRRWGIKDPLCGMKAYHIDIFNQLGTFDSYRSIGTELAIFAANQNIKIAQQHIKTKERQDRTRFGSRIFTNMIILRSLWIGYRKY